MTPCSFEPDGDEIFLNKTSFVLKHQPNVKDQIPLTGGSKEQPILIQDGGGPSKSEQDRPDDKLGTTDAHQETAPNTVFALVQKPDRALLSDLTHDTMHPSVQFKRSMYTQSWRHPTIDRFPPYPKLQPYYTGPLLAGYNLDSDRLTVTLSNGHLFYVNISPPCSNFRY
jgi:hypothetical protein